MKKCLVITLSAILLLTAAYVAAKTMRPAAVAGKFYPADKDELSSLVQGQLDNVTDLPEIDGQIVALIVPHAGLIYSGQIAAHAYKLLENQPINKVILCGPSHHYGFNGLSVYGPYVTWRTPLGNVNCNKKLGMGVMRFDKTRIDFLAEAHAKEHAIEVQLPYLQTVLDKFEIVPITMGYQDKSTIDLLTGALKSLDFDDSTIMIASSDLQHYRSADDGWKLDSVVVSCIENLDPIRLERAITNKTAEMCGGGPVVSVMEAAIAKGANKVKILKYGNSGQVSGDDKSVVGYVAAVIYKPYDKSNPKPKAEIDTKKEEKKLPELFKMDEDDKKQLLTIARKSIEQYLKDGTVPEFEVSDNLKKFGAAFVTLNERHHLRGCIGYTSAVAPLYQTVSECAIKAAVSDPRFKPVTADEVKDLDIEISVLSPMQEVNSFDEIEVGRDGLMVFLGSQRGLLLPQVAVNNNWSRDKFLEQTCIKAGLHPYAYKGSDIVIYKFQAVIFGEE